jgi:hypothetical protein
MILKIKNLKSDNYLTLKDQVLSSDFPWFFMKTTLQKNNTEYKDSSYFCHAVVKPPGNPNLYSTISSPYYSDLCNVVLQEIKELNQIKINSVIRVCFNMTLPIGNITSPPHYDHDFPHKNLLIYLNNSDGDTVVCEQKEERYSPIEDDIILFEGLHHHEYPKINNRVVMVVTFI